MIGGRLAGLRVLVTRPAPQGAALCALIEREDGEAIAFPAIAIAPAEDDASPRATLAALGPQDIAIFVSRNAVVLGLPMLPPADRGPAIAAIGPSTARALAAAGRPADIAPQGGFTSEALLAEPALGDVRGQRIVIVRGNGGRELLADMLSSRGADVRYAEVYRRTLPEVDAGPLIALWRQRGIHLVTATSVETLDNLVALLGVAADELLRRAVLVTASARVVQRAASMGLEHRPVLADGPDDQALLEAILAWRASALTR